MMTYEEKKVIDDLITKAKATVKAAIAKITSTATKIDEVAKAFTYIKIDEAIDTAVVSKIAVSCVARVFAEVKIKNAVKAAVDAKVAASCVAKDIKKIAKATCDANA